MLASTFSVQTSANRPAAVSRGALLFRDIIPGNDEAGHGRGTLDLLGSRVSPNDWRGLALPHSRLARPGRALRFVFGSARERNGPNLWIHCF
jgi:hypothetical protein